ncbi:MAG: hypothetical protein GXO45_03325 [Aquificae bacterium]|nr:hypothetical protein [Aquificota bacterium]
MRKELQKEKLKLENNENLKKSLEILNDYIEKYGEIKAFDFLFDVMEKSKPFVEELLNERKKQNPKYNKDQARRKIAGENFQFLVLYLLILNIEKGNLPTDLIVLKTKKHKIVDKYATIKIANETQKPDMDLVALSEDENKPIVIYSCKTSLRERAGQTYRWKLLVDIAKHCPTLIEKYKLEYPDEKEVLTGFITANFYEEITKPQQRGMLQFFDYSYIAKDIEIQPPIKKLSSIIEDLNTIFG